jgi:hypothetical protein
MHAAQPSSHPILTHNSAAVPVRWEGHMCDDVGCTYGATPLAFLSATSEELLLCGNRGSFRFSRETIRKLGRGKMYPWFFAAVRIHHDVPNIPRNLQFKPIGVRAREVLARLKELGYPAN